MRAIPGGEAVVAAVCACWERGLLDTPAPPTLWERRGKATEVSRDSETEMLTLPSSPASGPAVSEITEQPEPPKVREASKNPAQLFSAPSPPATLPTFVHAWGLQSRPLLQNQIKGPGEGEKVLATLSWRSLPKEWLLPSQACRSHVLLRSLASLDFFPPLPTPHPRGWQNRGESALIWKGAQCASELGPA